MSSLFSELLDRRVLIFDGAMGTTLHAHDLPLSDYDNLENCLEILNVKRPDVVEGVHVSFFETGCDAVETNSFGGSKLTLAEFGLADRTYELNKRSAELARKARDRFSTDDHPRFVVGSMGPGTKLPTLRQTSWDKIQDAYAEQARGLLDGGVDAVMIETCQDILQCKGAIAGVELAISENRTRVPIIVSITMETTGTMLLGTEIGAAVTALQAYPHVTAIGLNCATGPQEMGGHVRYLSHHSDRFISVLPNAGLPQLIDGKPHYNLTPEELARWLLEFVEADGVNIVGGCCGTTPAHIREVVKAVGHRAPKPRQVIVEPSVSSIYSTCSIRQDNSFLMIGERTNANGSKQFRELLQAEDWDGIVKLAKDQVRVGSHALDVCVAYVGRDETRDMIQVAGRLATEVTVPLQIDSTEPPVIETALKLAGGKCIINSINLEDGEERLAKVCTLAVKFGAALIALTIDEEGMAKTAERKLAVARRIHDLATVKYGVAASDLIFDPLTFTICTGNEDDRKLGLETLRAIKQIKEELPGVHTMLGVSNVSFGLKGHLRPALNSVFLHHAREHGLDAAIVNPAGIIPLYKIDETQRTTAEDLIYDRRGDGYDPLHAYLGLFEERQTQGATEKKRAARIEERLKQRIVDGDRTGLEDDLEEAMGKHAPMAIINDILLDGMKVVGELFAGGQMQLPFVLQSAETMKAAVRYLEPFMERASADSAKGVIVLATVRGDVHDIGKNLVDIVLTNNGYRVHNLGIKQPINNIIDAYQKYKADAIGLSGLLVKSTLVMRDDLAVLNEREINVPVILGGAALTRSYVEWDLRHIYKGPLFYAKDSFEGLDLMERIVGNDVADGLQPRERARRPKTPADGPAAADIPKVSAVDKEIPVPTPPFWGLRVVEHVPLRAVLGYMNETMLFQVQWGYRKAGRNNEEFTRYIDKEVRPTYRALVDQCIRDGILKPQATYGYWPAQSDGNDLIVFHPQDHDQEIARFTFPRQRKAPYWCLSDFFKSVESGLKDVVGFFIVTMGPRASEIAKQWFAEDRYKDYLHLHGLGTEGAEALAEYLHKQMRMELGIAVGDAREIRQLFQQKYHGSRYSFGYPACPSLEDQAKLWPLLEPNRIGITLSEEFMLDPEQSTSAMVCHHPEAKYFNANAEA